MCDAVYIGQMNCVTPLGTSLAENWQSILEGKSGIAAQDIGHFKNVYSSKILFPLHEEIGFTYLENLLLMASRPLLTGKILNSRIGFILSTTKGNIDLLASHQAEDAELSKTANKVAKELGFTTKPIVVSHACVSGLLAVIVAKRLIQMGQYDEVFVVAGDQVSEFVLSGFHSFQAMSDEPCKPFDKKRKGVTLGEAAAAVWITKELVDGAVEIIGEGSINDANHISGPSRTGEGLYRSIMSALKEAGISQDNVDFISAHGTATLYNDEMEAIAFDRVGISTKPMHSLKGYYGHTLGASGLLELLLATASLRTNTLIPSLGYADNGTSKEINIIDKITVKPISVALKTASGFGGSNAAILLKKI